MEKQFFFNGIDAETGEYLTPPKSASELAMHAQHQPRDESTEGMLATAWRTVSAPSLGLPFDVKPENIKEAGWGVVFHQHERREVKDAIAPLVEHRGKTVESQKLKILEYRDGEGWTNWLARYGVSPGTVDPRKIPYYLLFVGDPQKIPLNFLHLLDVEYAVGCLHFNGPDEYGRYTESIIEYESSSSVPNEQNATFFATRHIFDMATQYSSDLLATPLSEGTPEKNGQFAEQAIAERVGFPSRAFIGDTATRAALAGIFRPPAGKIPPAFLFTASHGFGYKRPHSDQETLQGALLCQDWPGFGSKEPGHYYAATDLPDDARVHGMICFHFACYSLGTPSHDRFFHKPGQLPKKIAAQPFYAALPKALLSHRNGGALACIGHVDRAFAFSFLSPEAGPQLQPFRNAIGRILLGQPVGHAVKDFNERYAALSVELASLLEEVGFGAKIPAEQLSSDWLARNDAEGYMVLGDPAVSLRIDALTKNK